MKLITTRAGVEIMVDDGDFPALNQHRWYIDGDGYARRNKSNLDKEGSRAILMHRVVMNAPTGMVVDHINGIRIDNRKENLRLVTPSENLRYAWRQRFRTCPNCGHCLTVKSLD